MTAETTIGVLFHAYDALRSYGVDFKSLREWKENGVLDEARKLKPQAMSEKVIAYLQRLRNAITAAVNRKVHIKLHTDNTLDNQHTPPTSTKH